MGRTVIFRLGIALAVVVGWGCSGDGEAPEDGGGVPDAGDASMPDGSVPDGSTSDGGGPDAGAGILDPGLGVSVGEFAEDFDPSNPEAAFDGALEQDAVDSARDRADYDDESGAMLAREWRCMVQLDRVEVHGPANGPFFQAGETGQVMLYGYDAEGRDWELLATQPVGNESPSAPVTFDASDLPATPYHGHGVAFMPDAPIVGGEPQEGSTTVRVAEVVFHGECVGEESTFAWNVGEWQCRQVECADVENEGTLLRTVFCERDEALRANDGLCPSPKPSTNDGTCIYECPYELVYIGDRDFTYGNDSGWLHEGRVGHRAGPLPSSVEFGTGVEAIEGNPCSVLTTNPETYFVGISCSGTDASYCAFQCLEP